MQKKIIMVVDDDESLRLLYQETLTEEGYEVMLAKNGKEAVRKVEQRPADLVVLDIVMPEMDGMEAMLRILRKHRKTPVILNTGYSRYRENFMTWAADAYVVKSSDLNELKAKVKEFLPMLHEEVEQPSSDPPSLGSMPQHDPLKSPGTIGQPTTRHTTLGTTGLSKTT